MLTGLVTMAFLLTSQQVLADQFVPRMNLPAIDLTKYTASNPLIMAHRGSPLKYPEHSYAGYSDALKNGADFIEQDIILSKDNHLVVSHANNLQVNFGKNLNITDSNYATLRKLHMKNGEKIHALNSVFFKYKDHTNYVIETKKSLKKNYQLEKEIVAAVKNNHLTNHVIFQSFSLKSLIYLHKKLPQVPLMLLVDGNHSNNSALQALLEELPDFIQIISFYKIGLNSENLRLIKDHHKIANVYSLDTKAEVDQAKSLGLTEYFSNNAGKMYKYINN